MPLNGVLCPCTPGKVLPLDHWEAYAEPPCGAWKNPLVVPTPLGICRAILDDKLTDTRHCNMNVTVTRVLDCARKWIIEDLWEHPLNVDTMHNLFIGSVWHAVAYDEGEDFEPTEMCGIAMTGSADEVSFDHTKIEDGKFHGDASLAYKLKAAKLVDDKLTAQLNLYRIGLEKKWDTPGKVVLLIGRHGAMRTSGNQNYYPVQVPIRDERWVAGVRPNDGRTTVGEIVEAVKAAKAAHAAGVSREEVLAQVPLHGRTMFPDKRTGQGRMCEAYCDKTIKAICDAEVAKGLKGGDEWK